MTYDVRNNRLLAMRMRDGDRWVNAYRERAWQAVLDEARSRSFLNAILFTVTHSFALLRDSKE